MALYLWSGLCGLLLQPQQCAPSQQSMGGESARCLNWCTSSSSMSAPSDLRAH